MKMANINVRIDSNIKENAEAVFASLGITPTAAISLFYNQVIRTNSIPFELKADIPNEKTLSAIDEVEEMEKNKEKYKGYKNIDGLLDDITPICSSNNK
ncbi:MAG: type II toxin-antitoxin system RelB/DinJ family antitoxin [Bacilli bacterium]|nr:type II toxin-antitoxin system RelB/DinJ family antitoxin [Bacilli bacterium]